MTTHPKKTLPAATHTQSALEELDRVFHEKARLGILTTLIGAVDGMNFIELKELCDLTDGNLNRHLKVLVDAGVLGVKKSGQGRNTNSVYRLTANGRRAFDRYLEALETVLEAARKNVASKTTSTSTRTQSGFRVETP